MVMPKSLPRRETIYRYILSKIWLNPGIRGVEITARGYRLIRDDSQGENRSYPHLFKQAPSQPNFEACEQSPCWLILGENTPLHSKVLLAHANYRIFYYFTHLVPLETCGKLQQIHGWRPVWAATDQHDTMALLRIARLGSNQVPLCEMPVTKIVWPQVLIGLWKW